jgi:hypothetical protein
MVEDLDVWRSAHVLTMAHGRDSLSQAGFRADATLEQQDVDWRSVRLRIMMAV